MSIEQATVDQVQQALFPEEIVDEPLTTEEEAPVEETEEVEVEETETEEEVVQEEQQPEEDSLAAVLGVPEDQVAYDEDGNIVFKAKVDGEEIPVSFQELVKGYQLEKYVTKKSMELSEQQRQLDTEYTTQVSALKQKIDVADSMLESMKDSLKAEYQSVDWEQLKQVDPGRFVSLREDFQKRAAHFSKVEAKLAEESQQQQEAFQQHQAEIYQKHLKEQSDMLLRYFPDWQDPEKFQNEGKRLASFIQDEYGFTQQEADGILDHRLVRVLEDAYRYKNASKSAKKKLEKAAIPTFKKPTPRGGDTTKARAVKSKIAKLKKTGSTSDLASLLLDRM